MTIIYNYSAITGEFVGSETAQISPLDPENFLIPANATEIEPPAFQKGTIAVFSNGEWSIKTDLRGTNYWMPDFSMHYQDILGELPAGASLVPPENHLGTVYWLADGSKHVMDTYGALPEGASLTPPPPTQFDTTDEITAAIQIALDGIAKAWGYDSVVSCASYAASTNKQYAADAAQLIEWRDAVWMWANPLFANVIAGETPAAFMATMPAQPEQPKVS